MPQPSLQTMLSDLRYLAIPILAIVFAQVFAATAFARTPMACTMQYDPVCAAKQVQCVRAPCNPVYQTYGNACMASADEAVIVHTGECTGNEGVSTDPKPYVPPTGCTAWFDGCNNCSIGTDGYAMCTLRACMNEPQPGYCTSYEKPKPFPGGGGTNVGSGTVSPGTTTPPVVATSTPPVPPNENGVFHRIWNWLRHLLRF